MKTVSAAYKAAMEKPLRNPSFVKILFQNIDADAANKDTLTDNGHMDWSDLSTLDYEYTYGAPYATLELNRWTLDGRFRIKPDSPDPDGYISSQMTNESGVFTEQPVVTITFSDVVTLPGLTLTFDSRTGEFPTQIKVDYLLDSSVVLTQTVDAQLTTLLTAPVGEADTITITYIGSFPYHRARLENIVFGINKIFTGKDLTGTKQSNDVDPLSRRLPKESASFELIDFAHEYDADNPQGIWVYVDANSPFSIQYGCELDDETVEWLAPDNYVLDGKPEAKNGIASFKGTGLIGSLNRTYYKSTLGEKTLYDMAVAVLEDAQLTPTTTGGNPWLIDDSLRSISTTAALPIDSHSNCLQMIAHAACCELYTDSDNIIHISPFSLDSEATDFVLDFSTIGEKSQALTKTEVLKEVQVSKFSYTVAENASNVYQGTTTENNLHIEFSSFVQDVSINVTGGTLTSSDIYARAADLILSDGAKTITITGKTLSEQSVVLSYPVAASGAVDEEKNPLVTTDEMASTLANHVASYLAYRNTYDANYRGNPELETKDKITLQTPFSQSIPAIVLTDEITFNGSLSGKVKVKALT